MLYTYNSHDAMDVIGLAVPVQFDGIRMNPFGMYSAIGKDTRFGAGANNKTGVASGLLPVGTREGCRRLQRQSRQRMVGRPFR